MSDRSKSVHEIGGAELHRKLLGYFRRRARDRQDAPDLVHDVYVRVYSQSAERQGAIQNVSRYCFSAASSVLIDRRRRDASRFSEVHEPLESELPETSNSSPERILEAREMLGRALIALDALPERTRSIFLLHRIDGYSYPEIADQLGVSRKAVEKHMTRAIKHLASLRENLT